MANQVLKDELTLDPLARGYAGMNDAQVVADLNRAIQDNWVMLLSSDIFEAIDVNEFMALSPAQQSRIDRILGLGTEIRTAPSSHARAELLDVFTPGSATITSLIAIANQKISRATELGLGHVREGHVMEGRL